MINRIILVDNNTTRVTNIQNEIKQASLTDSVAVTLNGGHALLYLDHTYHKIKDSKILILLNIHTPMVNGFEFLEGYNETSQFKKQDIQIAVMEDNLKEEEIEKVKKFGVSHFFSVKNMLSAITSLLNPNSSKWQGNELSESTTQSVLKIEDAISEQNQTGKLSEPISESSESQKVKKKRTRKSQGKSFNN